MYEEYYILIGTNVEINNRLIACKQRPKYKINGHLQYDTFLMVEQKSKVKAKKKVVQKDSQVFGTDTSEDEDE